jgi:hypothetical protein
MRNEPRQKTIDSNSQRETGQRSRQSRQKSTPREAPLKEHGQPAWRDVKED